MTATSNLAVCQGKAAETFSLCLRPRSTVSKLLLILMDALRPANDWTDDSTLLHSTALYFIQELLKSDMTID